MNGRFIGTLLLFHLFFVAGSSSFCPLEGISRGMFK